MKLRQIFAATLFTLSLVGCSCGRSCVMDSCDPCGGYVDSGCGGCGGCGSCSGSSGGLFRRFSLFPWKSGSVCSSCGSVSSCGGGCGGGCGGTCGGTCGGGGGCSGCGGGGMTAYGMPAQSSCGCGQTGSYDSNYPGSSVPYIDNSGGAPVPSLRSAPIPPASPAAPTPSTSIPAIPGSESTMMSPYTNGQTQTVSYEEFQRLPGTIIAGPGAVTPAAPASNAPFIVPPSPGVSGATASNTSNWVAAPVK